MNKMFTPPMNISERDFSYKSVFLAGSIELGIAEDWQTNMCNFLLPSSYNVFNPRRPDWDSSWEQDFTNPNFSQQVNWELNALEVSDIIVMYFDKDTRSPISLLELGLYAQSGKIHVVCPKGFWRKGNVDIVCNKYGIPMYGSLEHFKTYMMKYER
jgi:hypothetical protein